MENIKGVIEFLNRHDLSVTTAESCTAGLVAAFMADVSGCGTALQSGFVVYSAAAKTSHLDVSQQTIQTFGLTSEEVAREMAVGALKKSSAQLILSITGMAESDDCLNGVICFAYVLRTANGYKVISETKQFDGQRNEVRKSAALHALLAIPGVYEKLQIYPEIFA